MKVRFTLALAVLAMMALPVFAQEAAMTPQTVGGVTDLVVGFPTQMQDTVTTPQGKFEGGVNVGYFNADFEKFGTNLWQINYGFMPNLQGYINAPLIIGEAKQNTNGNTNWELLYRINDETDTIPSFGVEGIATAPTGGENTGWNGTGSLVISKSFGAWRGHFNGGYTTIGKNGSLPVFGTTLWNTSASNTSYVDTFLLGADYAAADNMLILADVVTQRSPVSGDKRANLAELGMRYGLSDVDIVSGGVGVGFGPSAVSPDFTVTLGYQRLF